MPEREEYENFSIGKSKVEIIRVNFYHKFATRLQSLCFVGYWPKNPGKDEML